MRLIDTSAWVEWLIGSAVGERVATMLPPEEEWLVPTIVQLELAKWLNREVGEEKADQVVAFTQTCRIAVLDTGIALAAAEACRVHRLATADAVVWATAQAYRAEVITCDVHFDGMPGVVVIPKGSAG